MVECTVVIFKPSVYSRRLNGEILARLERTGLLMYAAKTVTVTAALATSHYQDAGEKHGPEVLNRLVQQLLKHNVLAMVFTGRNAVNTIRRVVGDHYDPACCMPGSVRADYACDTYERALAEDRAIDNIAHASSSAEDAARELELWFPEIAKGEPFTE